MTATEAELIRERELLKTQLRNTRIDLEKVRQDYENLKLDCEDAQRRLANA